MSNDPVKELIDFLRSNNIGFTFDRFRDIRKGCGEHCKAWAGNASKDMPYCANHQAAIERGEYKPR